MNELLQRLLSGDLKDLTGLQLTGTIPIRQELLNEALAETLRAGVPPAGTSNAPKADVNALLSHVKKAEVDARDGKLTLTFEIRVDPA